MDNEEGGIPETTAKSVVEPRLENIPSELRGQANWVVWKARQEKQNDGTLRVNKIPRDPKTEGAGKSNDPTTWGSYEQATETYQRRPHKYAGVGFVFSENDPFVGVDLDKCRDPDTGEIEPWAKEIIKQFATYTEVSPSGTGVKMFVRGKLPDGSNNKAGNVEAYSKGRFFTVTGHRIAMLDGVLLPGEPQERETELEWLAATHLNNGGTGKRSAVTKEETRADSGPPRGKITAWRPDPEKVQAMLDVDGPGGKLSTTFHGKRTDLKDTSPSGHDLALASILAHSGITDPEEIAGWIEERRAACGDSVEKLYKHPTYLADTIAKALDSAPLPPGVSSRMRELDQRFPSKLVMEAFEDNEAGEGRLCVEIHRGKFVYDHLAKRWFRYDGCVWVHDDKNEVLNALDDVVTVYQIELARLAWRAGQAAREGLEDKANAAKTLHGAILKRILLLNTKKRRKDVLEFAAAGEGSLGISGKEWDQAKWQLPTPNGKVDLRTGALIPGRPEDYIKTTTNAVWLGSEAPCPEWVRFLLSVFDGDKELVAFIQRLLGYAITGTVIEHIFPLFVGEGRNGKGTIFRMIKHVLGDLSGAVEPEMLMVDPHGKKSGGPTSDLMFLRGKRIVFASESGEGDKLNGRKLKTLTGGDHIVGRNLYEKDQVNLTPTHTLILGTNHLPRTDTDDYGLWERIHVIRFPLSFVDEPKCSAERKADKYLQEKLEKEASGILAWLVKGAMEWQRFGLCPPDSVRLNTRSYREGQSGVDAFLEECCIIEPGARTAAADLYQAYVTFTREEEGLYCLSSRKFSEAMLRRFTRDDTGRHRFYVGVRLKG